MLLLGLPMAAATGEGETTATTEVLTIADLPHFDAAYRILRNGRTLAEVRRTLRCSEVSCEYRQQGHTTGFVNVIVRGELDEVSRFLVVDGALVPNRYYYREKLLGKEQVADLHFDPATLQISNRGDKEWVKEYPADGIDELLAQLQLMLAVMRGERELAFNVIDRRGRAREYAFRISGEEAVTTAAGELRAVRVDYLDARRPGRETYIWFAPEFAYLPVLIHQEREDGTTWRYELTELP